MTRKTALLLADVLGSVFAGAFLAVAFAFPFLLIYAVLLLFNVDVGQLTW